MPNSKIATKLDLPMRVRIDDWANPRDVWEKGGKLFLQVSKGHIDCPICQSRVRFVSAALHVRRVEHVVHTDTNRDVVDIGLPIPPAGKGVPEYLQEILGIPVSAA